MYHLMIARVVSDAPKKELGELSGKQFDDLMAEQVKKGYHVHTAQLISADGHAVNVFILWEMIKG